MQINLSYVAQNAGEFMELVEKYGERVSPSISAPATSKGPNELRFNDEVGILKLHKDERARVESGEVTREDIALERLEKSGPIPSSDDVMDGPSLAYLQYKPEEEIEDKDVF